MPDKEIKLLLNSLYGVKGIGEQRNRISHFYILYALRYALPHFIYIGTDSIIVLRKGNKNTERGNE